MYFLLSLITTAVLGYFMPQWVYNISWTDLINAIQGNTSDLEKFIKEAGIIDKTAVEVAREELIITSLIVIGIFIAMLIITNIIKKAVKK